MAIWCLDSGCRIGTHSRLFSIYTSNEDYCGDARLLGSSMLRLTMIFLSHDLLQPYRNVQSSNQVQLFANYVSCALKCTTISLLRYLGVFVQHHVINYYPIYMSNPNLLLIHCPGVVYAVAFLYILYYCLR